MATERDTTRIVRSWLEEGRTALPDYVLDTVLDQLPATRQRRSWWPARRFADMNALAKLAIAAAAVAVVAIVGINLVPGNSGGVGGSGPSPSSSLVPTPTPTATPGRSTSLLTETWPVGSLAPGRQAVALQPCDPRGRPCNTATIPFTFVLPSSGWRSDQDSGMLGTGTFPTADNAWMVFLGPISQVSTDPCKGESKATTGGVTGIANALTKIPGTDAVGPTDVTVGGHPGKLVVLTIHGNVACDLSKFWLFGDTSLYPNSLESTIGVRIVEVGGEPFIVYTDQTRPNPALEREIQQIVDSIAFE